MKKTFIIDGNSLLNRAFYALPPLTNAEGLYLNAVYGFTNMIVKMIKENVPDYILVTFDLKAPTFRHDLYKEYKGNRKKMPDELAEQIPLVKELLKDMGIKIVEKEGYEADDIIGYATNKFKSENIVLTGDKDNFQLINDNTKVWFTKRGISQIDVYDKKSFFNEYGFEPLKIIDLKALMGDSSDNIPGVEGVGEKTAKKLLLEYGSLENIYENIDEIKGKLKERLIDNKDIAFKSKKLATILLEFDIDINLNDCKYDFPFSKKVYDKFRKYDFNSLIKDENLFENEVSEEKNTIKVKRSNINSKEKLEKLVEEIKKENSPISIYINDDIHIGKTSEEIIIDIKKDLISEGISFDLALKTLKSLLEDSNMEIVLFDYKEMLKILDQYKIKTEAKVFDILIAQYLASGSKKQNTKFSEFSDENSLNKDFPAAEIMNLSKDLKIKLKDYDMMGLYYDIEIKLAKILSQMQKEGFNIDFDVLQDIKEKYTNKMQDLTSKIHNAAGEKFNINSPKQMGEILFDKLEIKSFNNKKKSTGISILEKLKDKHEIVPLIIEYRHISKLVNTYIESFNKLVSKNNTLISTEFNQVLTSTGRLSSSKPNLQNIPIRTPEGKELRKIFISRFSDGLLLSADYSQIELRLLAHYSGDEKLVAAYRENKDIHTQTASDIFDIDINEVDDTTRRDAKAVNFGIIYGISDYGLSQNIGGTRVRSKDYIDRYFDTYKGVKEFMDRSVEDAKQKGYVSTLMGRRRMIPEINSKRHFIRQASERAAMNMPLQGSASDIIKIAMINVNNRLEKENLKSKLILQVHDEIIIDVHKEELEKVKEIVKSEMENVAELKVPLLVDISVGKNLFEAK